MADRAPVSGIRVASRDLVRHRGFLGRGVAGTDLSGSAAHALIEIGAAPGLGARDLAARLRLDTSTVSRLVRTLVAPGAVVEAGSNADRQTRRLALTDRGQATPAAIDRTAEAQVAAALARLAPDARTRVPAGLSAYAAALAPEAEIVAG